jgi:hypothetical protein
VDRAAAVTRISASTPDILRVFRHLNHGKPYADQAKPFNFLVSVQTERLQHP